MNKTWGYFILFSLIALSLVFSSCGAGVTETGNPTTVDNSGDPNSFEPNQGDGTGIFDGTVDAGDMISGPDSEGEEPVMAPIPETETETILNQICEVLAGCYSSLNQELCLSELDADNGLLTEMGVNTTTYDSFAELQTAVDANTIEISSTEISSCASDISAVSCSEIEASGAFSESTLTDFTDVYLMIPDGC